MGITLQIITRVSFSRRQHEQREKEKGETMELGDGKYGQQKPQSQPNKSWTEKSTDLTKPSVTKADDAARIKAMEDETTWRGKR
jgi:hypothetical protein